MKTLTQPVRRDAVLFSAEALKFLNGGWIGAGELVMPAYCLVISCGQMYGGFLSFKPSEEGDGEWMLLYQDLFANGGADGDCESFPSFDLAVARANEVIERDGYEVFPVKNSA